MNQKNLPCLIFVLALGVFGVMNTELGIIGILPQISKSLHISISKAGNFITIFALMISISGFFISTLFSKFNRKHVILFGIFMFILSNIISLCFSSYFFILLSRMTAGIFHPLFFSLTLAYAETLTTKEKTGRVLALVLTGMTIAMLVGIPLSSTLASLYGYKASFLFCLFLNIISFIAMLFILPPIKNFTSITYKDHFKNLLEKNTLFVMLIEILFFLTTFSFYTYISPYLLEVFKVSLNFLTILLFTYGIGSVFGNYCAGRLIGSKISFFISFFTLIYFITFIVLFFIPPIHNLIFLFILFFGFIQSMIPLLTLSFLLEFGFKKNRELGNAVSGSCANIGITIGSGLGGFFIYRFGIKELPFIGIFCLIIVIFLLSFFYRKKSKNL